MSVSELPPGTFTRRLGHEGIAFHAGPFVVRVVANVAELAAPLRLLYGDLPLVEGGIVDFHIRLQASTGPRRWLRPQVVFVCDGETPFFPLPRRLALALLEWGINWCVHHHAHQYLLIHAAVVERDGAALILPGPPGSGKSTLCAALVHRGWRLLSDEIALIDLADASVLPLARPVALKNESIDVLHSFAPAAVFGPVVRETVKGAIAHMKPPPDSVRRMHEAARPAALIFPEFAVDAAINLAPLPKARAFFQAADLSFNYHILGERGFDALSRLIDGCRCFSFTYSSLDDAVGVLAGLEHEPLMTGSYG